MTSKHATNKAASPARVGDSARVSEAELALPQKTDLPLAEDPIVQVAVPATINGTSPLDPSEGPIPPKHRKAPDPRRNPDRSRADQPQAFRE